MTKLLLFLFILLGFGLRLYYVTHTHPFFDEFTTVLATRQILQHGWPVLPSGLFYEHGLLATYLITPFAAFFVNTPTELWHAADWGLMMARWPSVLLGTITIPLVYKVSCRVFPPSIAPAIGLFAAGFFALSPEGMVWGGRARMYALATLLVLLTVYWAYRGSVYPAPAKYRWAALFALLATLLTQFGALMMGPPLVIAMVVVAWQSWPRNITSTPRIWFLRPAILFEGVGLGAVLGTAILVKRLGRPIGMDNLTESNGGGLLETLINTVAYQTAFHFTIADTTKFLGRQFGVPHHYWLSLIAVVGSLLVLIFWVVKRFTPHPSSLPKEKEQLDSPFPQGEGLGVRGVSKSHFFLFLWLIFGLIILEMVTLLEPFRRNPRYIVMYLPLFYLIVGGAIFHVIQFVKNLPPSGGDRGGESYSKKQLPLFALVLLLIFTVLSLSDLKIALQTPEPAYEEAFAYVHNEWQPGDAVITMNVSAAELYLDEVTGFAVQNDADQFLLNRAEAPVDRWLGVPWLGDDISGLNGLLNQHDRVWFVIDTIRQPVYFRGDWLALQQNQMEQVWANDDALVYRTRSERTPLPTSPQSIVQANLNDTIELTGYAWQENTDIPTMVLFWHPLSDPNVDYTMFLHLRDEAGATLAQRDGQPLNGVYPTSQWQPNETIIDPVQLPQDVPPGDYQLVVGLYDLQTLERLPVQNDTSGENAVFLGQVTIR